MVLITILAYTSGILGILVLTSKLALTGHLGVLATNEDRLLYPSM